jgi:sugar-specific transcriptional regulator TrmB
MGEALSNAVNGELKSLGFSDYEIRTYVALLQDNPATAYQISKNANIPRANAYSVLEGLSRKNAVLAVSKNPARFVPVSPDALFQQIARDTQERCSYLEEELSMIDTSDATEAVWNIEGQIKIDKKTKEIISVAKRHVWIKADKVIVERFVNELSDASKRGVSLLIVLFGIDHNPFEFSGDATVLLHEGNGVRMGDADNLFTISTDFETALTANVTGVPTAAYTQSRPVVTISESLIRHDMYMAEIFMKFGKEIDEEFGPHLFKLRSRYFSDQQMIKLSETMSVIPSWSEKPPRRTAKKGKPKRKAKV